MDQEVKNIIVEQQLEALDNIGFFLQGTRTAIEETNTNNPKEWIIYALERTAEMLERTKKAVEGDRIPAWYAERMERLEAGELD